MKKLISIILLSLLLISCSSETVNQRNRSIDRENSPAISQSENNQNMEENTDLGTETDEDTINSITNDSTNNQSEESESYNQENNNITNNTTSISENFISKNNNSPSPLIPPDPAEDSSYTITEEAVKVTCPNAFYDVNQSCDWIHPNMLPIDELGREVPKFATSQDAWNWGEAQMYDESSK